jgi:hypothetical protein
MRRRVSIREMLVVVTVLALGLGAMKSGSQHWLQATSTLTLVSLSVGLLGALLRAHPHGAWVGFALFGWGSYLLAYLPPIGPFGYNLADTGLTEAIIARLLRFPPAPPGIIGPASPPHPTMSPEEYARAFPIDSAIQMQNASVLGPPLPAQISDYIKAYNSMEIRRSNSREIAQLQRCLILGFVGSLLGRSLAPRSEPQPQSPS